MRATGSPSGGAPRPLGVRGQAASSKRSPNGPATQGGKLTSRLCIASVGDSAHAPSPSKLSAIYAEAGLDRNRKPTTHEAPKAALQAESSEVRIAALPSSRSPVKRSIRTVDSTRYTPWYTPRYTPTYKQPRHAASPRKVSPASSIGSDWPAMVSRGASRSAMRNSCHSITSGVRASASEVVVGTKPGGQRRPDLPLDSNRIFKNRLPHASGSKAHIPRPPASPPAPQSPSGTQLAKRSTPRGSLAGGLPMPMTLAAPKAAEAACDMDFEFGMFLPPPPVSPRASVRLSTTGEDLFAAHQLRTSSATALPAVRSSRGSELERSRMLVKSRESMCSLRNFSPLSPEQCADDSDMPAAAAVRASCPASPNRGSITECVPQLTFRLSGQSPSNWKARASSSMESMDQDQDTNMLASASEPNVPAEFPQLAHPMGAAFLGTSHSLDQLAATPSFDFMHDLQTMPAPSFTPSPVTAFMHVRSLGPKLLSPGHAPAMLLPQPSSVGAQAAVKGARYPETVHCDGHSSGSDTDEEDSLCWMPPALEDELMMGSPR